MRVLIVEDIKDVADALADLLQLLGHQCRVVHDGAAAIGAAVDQHPDLVLLDIGLPAMDGYEVARRLRQRIELSTTRLVAMTGYGAEDDRRRAREAGFDLHLTKPVDLEELERLLVA